MALERSKVQVNIPDEFVPIVNSFASKAISLAQAAQLSGRSLLDFMEILKSRGLHWGEYTEEQQAQDDESLRKLFDEIGTAE